MPAVLTPPTVPTVPAHAYPIAAMPPYDIWTNPFDYPGDFMSWHSRILQARPFTVHGQCVAVTDSARLHPDQDMPLGGFRYIALNKFEWPSR
jgi:hypothetical protein